MGEDFNGSLPERIVEAVRAMPEDRKRALAIFIDHWGLDAYQPPEQAMDDVRDIVRGVLLAGDQEAGETAAEARGMALAEAEGLLRREAREQDDNFTRRDPFARGYVSALMNMADAIARIAAPPSD